jgi:hypothetical protein
MMMHGILLHAAEGGGEYEQGKDADRCPDPRPLQGTTLSHGLIFRERQQARCHWYRTQLVSK